MGGLSFVIQLVSIVGASIFMIMIFRLIIKGRLREEYSIVWILCTLILIVFSIWRKGLEQISLWLGVYYPPSLIFLAAIFAIIVFLVHLSVVNSKLQSQIKTLTHEMAYLKQALQQVELNAKAPTTETVEEVE
ncbi:DUF2304 domain-containing protein [Fibrella forsythiae]|uniref:DUF2304 domain-containing protein n=1 Tax=Fibrella forsythiae TaxID=2817061 RepID=A0ABS3JJ71_9BACT|nr:DUF2304 domain-containing protein [Fibrella forsythiae]MBO0950055.1 DUF2304 domain-containing protein [Fibrella forsythiae]